MHNCPVCGEYMHADEEWQLRAGLAVGQPAEGGDYVHKRCAENATEAGDSSNGGSK